MEKHLGKIPLTLRRCGEKYLISRRNNASIWGGFFLYAMPDDYIGSAVISSRRYEPHVTAVVRRELRPGDTFLDIGGNIGYFSMLASSIVGQSGKVITFEPNPQNLQLIYESQLRNGFVNQAIYPYAVSDQPGILRFTTVGSNGGVVTETSQDQNHYLLVQAAVCAGGGD